MIVELPYATKNLSRLIDAIEAGGETEIVITRDGRPIAKLVPTVATIDTSKRLGWLAGRFPPMSLEDFEADNDEIAAMFCEGEADEPTT